MASEITVTSSLTATKGNSSAPRRSDIFRPTWTGTRHDSGTQDIGFAAHELLVISAEMTTFGWAYFKNADATNYVELGRDVTGTFYPFARLNAGESAVLRLAQSSVYAKANTAAVVLEFMILET